MSSFMQNLMLATSNSSKFNEIIKNASIYNPIYHLRIHGAKDCIVINAYTTFDTILQEPTDLLDRFATKIGMFKMINNFFGNNIHISVMDPNMSSYKKYHNVCRFYEMINTLAVEIRFQILPQTIRAFDNLIADFILYNPTIDKHYGLHYYKNIDQLTFDRFLRNRYFVPNCDFTIQYYTHDLNTVAYYKNTFIVLKLFIIHLNKIFFPELVDIIVEYIQYMMIAKLFHSKLHHYREFGFIQYYFVDKKIYKNNDANNANNTKYTKTMASWRFSTQPIINIISTMETFHEMPMQKKLLYNDFLHEPYSL